MINTIYIEHNVADHPGTRDILQRYPDAMRISCHRYTEIFNRKAQHFRLQKKRPALILAEKFRNHVLHVPENYNIGAKYNYYFSHMLNCIYDCRYCFLQGMFRSAHYVLFVNFDGFASAIEKTIKQHDGEVIHFFSGYDCDSLALDPVTGFTGFFLPLFRKYPAAWLELRTKSTQIRTLLETEPLENCIVAYSFTPEEIARVLEHKAPSVQRRLEAMLKLQEAGWRLGLRFDPLIYEDGYSEKYHHLFQNVFSRLNIDNVHSVSLGSFRLPKDYFRSIQRQYPDEALFASPLAEENGMMAYRQDIQTKMLEFCSRAILSHIPKEKFFPCHGIPGSYSHRL